MDDGALSIDSLLATLESGAGTPPRDKIADPNVLKPAAQQLNGQLKSLAVALEYSGKPPEGLVAAKISPFRFGTRESGDQDSPAEPVVADSFPYGTDEVLVMFDYEAMQDGQEVLYKVYVDGEEDPSWRLITPWDLGASGSAEKPLSLAYSDTFVLSPGQYTVEMYVNHRLAQSGSFTVEEDTR